jgi:uncharacterized protein (TIGR00369 family)
MPDYASLLNAIASGSLKETDLSSAAASSLDVPRLLDWQPGKVRASWQLDPKYLNSRGVLFGGYYGVLADFVLAFTAMTVLEQDEQYITQDLAVSFYKSVAVGTLDFASEVLTRTRSRICVQCRVYDEYNNMLALASATQHVRRGG